MTDGPVLRLVHAERELQRKVTLRKAKSFAEGLAIVSIFSFCGNERGFG